MLGYKSKTQSKTQSKKNLKSSNKAKNGGRRRKQTMKKVRRGKKVMRGGALSKTYKLNPDNGMTLPKEIGELIKAGKNNTDKLEFELLSMPMEKSKQATFNRLYEEIVPVSLRTVNSNGDKVDQMLKVIINHLSSDFIDPTDKIDLPKLDQSKAVSPSEMFASNQYRNSTQEVLRGDMPKVVTEGLDTGFNKGEIPRGVMSGAFGYEPTH